jgi:hypothetical protein
VSSGQTGQDVHTIPFGPRIRSRSLLLFAMAGFDLPLRLIPLVDFRMVILRSIHESPRTWLNTSLVSMRNL